MRHAFVLGMVAAGLLAGCGSDGAHLELQAPVSEPATPESSLEATPDGADSTVGAETPVLPEPGEAPRDTATGVSTAASAGGAARVRRRDGGSGSRSTRGVLPVRWQKVRPRRRPKSARRPRRRRLGLTLGGCGSREFAGLSGRGSLSGRHRRGRSRVWCSSGMVPTSGRASGTMGGCCAIAGWRPASARVVMCRCPVWKSRAWVRWHWLPMARAAWR